MRTLGLIRRATPAVPGDPWPRLRARLAAGDDVVPLTLPAVGWREVMALVASLGVLAVAPDSLALLAASGLL